MSLKPLHRAALLMVWLLPLLPSMAAAQPANTTDVESLQRLAHERYVEGDLESATRLYLEIARLETSPDTRAKAFVTASWLQHLQQRDLAALDSLTQALTLDPQFPFDASHYNRDFEVLYQRAGDQVARTRQRRADRKIQEALVAMEAERDFEARLRLQEALDLTPDNAVAIYNLALLDLEGGADGQAMTRFERVVSLTFNDSDPSASSLRAKAQTSIGVIFFERGDWQESEAAFLEATRAHPEEVLAWKNLGLARIEQGNDPAAVQALQTAIGLDPDDPELTRHLADALTRSARGPEAVNLLTRSLERHPRNATLWLSLGEAQLHLGSSEQAALAFQRAIEADPGNTEAARRNLEIVRGRLTTERAIVAGSKTAPRTRNKPIPPKKIGLRFVELNYKKLNLRGALVDSVNKKTPAARAGLRKGDLVLWIGEYGLLSDKDFFEYLKRSPPGETLDVQYLRDGRLYGANLQLR